jgi:hypothetical protein
MIRILPALLLLSLPAAGFAQEQVVTLSPEARAKILDAAEQGGGPSTSDLSINGLGGKIHGEVGAFVGTGGARGVFGTAAVPIGQDGMASFSFENSRTGNNRYRY